MTYPPSPALAGKGCPQGGIRLKDGWKFKRLQTLIEQPTSGDVEFVSKGN